MEEHVTQIVHSQPYHIKLVKGQRDAYGWEISIHGTDTDIIIQQLKEIDERMRKGFMAEESA
jgi:hypothetical protein